MDIIVSSPHKVLVDKGNEVLTLLLRRVITTRRSTWRTFRILAHNGWLKARHRAGLLLHFTNLVENQQECGVINLRHLFIVWEEDCFVLVDLLRILSNSVLLNHILKLCGAHFPILQALLSLVCPSHSSWWWIIQEHIFNIILQIVCL